MTAAGDLTWLFQEVRLKTKSEYDAGFGYGGAKSSISLGNSSTKVDDLAALKEAMRDTAWTATWSDDQALAYGRALKHFSTAALRLTLAAHDVPLPPPGNKTANAQRRDLHALLEEKRVPLSSPQYLIAFLEAVKSVREGVLHGDEVFAMGMELATAGAGRGPPPQEKQAQPPSVEELMRQLKDAQGALATEQAKNKRPRPPAQNDTGLAGLSGQQILNAFAAHTDKIVEGMKGMRQEEKAQPPKKKSPWVKLQDEATEALVANTYLCASKLSRANQQKLKEEGRKEKTQTTTTLGPGVSLTHSDDIARSATVDRTQTDSRHMSMLFGFYRTMSMMVDLSEEEFPRARLRDFFGLWTTIWESTNGSNAAKLEAFDRWYSERASSLGEGSWVRDFRSDNLMLNEMLRGPNVRYCASCSGTCDGAPLHAPPASAAPNRQPQPTGGNGGGNARGGGNGGRGNGNGGRRNGGGNSNTPRDGNANSRGGASARDRDGRNERPCLQMVDPTATCRFGPNCSFEHSPCFVCGGSCKSAHACPDYDSNRERLQDKYGALIRSRHNMRKDRGRDRDRDRDRRRN